MELIPMFETLKELRERIQVQYLNLEKMSKFKDTLMFEVYLQKNDNDLTLKKLIDYLAEDTADFFNCSNFHWVEENIKLDLPFAASASFKFKGSYKTKNLEMPIKIIRSLKHKCIRCFKYLAEEENSICPYCMTFLPTDFDVNAVKSL